MIYVRGFYEGVEYDDQGNPTQGHMIVLTDGQRTLSVPVSADTLGMLDFWLKTTGQEVPLPAEPMRPRRTLIPEPDTLIDDGGYLGGDDAYEDPVTPPNDFMEQTASDDFARPPSAVFDHEPDSPGELRAPLFSDDDGVGQI